MNRIAAVVAGLSLAFIGTSTTIADTINVPGDQPTIAAAISASVNGDVINIAPGTYNEYELNPGGKAITIQGTRDMRDGTLWRPPLMPSITMAACSKSTPVKASGTVIKDLVITGGSGTDLGGFTAGGGIYTFNSSNPDHHRLHGSQATRVAGRTAEGSMCEGTGSDPTIIDCTIDGQRRPWYSAAGSSAARATGRTSSGAA